MAKRMSYALLSLKTCSQEVKLLKQSIRVAAKIGDRKSHDQAVAGLLETVDDIIALMTVEWKSNPPSPSDEMEKLQAAFASHQDLAHILLSDRPNMTEKQRLAALSRFRRLTKRLRATARDVYKMMQREWPDKLTGSVEHRLRKYAKL